MSEFKNIRFYLDANILFSASYRDRNNFLPLWHLRGALPVTSNYAIQEARKHSRRLGQLDRLELLLLNTSLVDDVGPGSVFAATLVVDKDKPILASAVAASVDYLVTGDAKHFGRLYDSTVGGVYVIRPGDFLARNAYRLVH